MAFYASKIWQMIPMEIKTEVSQNIFKNIGFTVRIRKFGLISNARKFLSCRQG